MNGDQNDYALSLDQDELHALATLIHDECKCVPANNGGGDCDWCRVYYATTDLTEEIKACVGDLRLRVDTNRRALGQEICEGLEVRGHQAPKNTASSDIIGAVFRFIDSQADEIKCDDKLLEGRERLLAELPECPSHGSGCTPNSVDAIRALVAVKDVAAKILRGMVFTRDTPAEQLDVTWRPMCFEDAKHKDDECQSAWDELEQALAELKPEKGNEHG